jgi:hypothetical protein
MAADNPTKSSRRLVLGGSQVLCSTALVRDEFDTVVTFQAPLKGWDSPAGIKGTTTANTFGRGATPENYELTERTVLPTGNIIALDYNPKSLRDRIERLLAAIPLKHDVPLVLHEFDEMRHLMVRNGGEQDIDRPGEVRNSGLVMPYSLQLIACDGLKLSGDGTKYTFDKMTEWGGPGSLTYVNAGEAELAPTLFRVTNCMNPVFTMDGVQQRFSDLIVPQDWWLEINFDTGAVMLRQYTPDGKVLISEQNVRSHMNNTWLPLPNKRYTVDFAADSYGSKAQFNIKSYDSFL